MERDLNKIAEGQWEEMARIMGFKESGEIFERLLTMRIRELQEERRKWREKEHGDNLSVDQ